MPLALRKPVVLPLSEERRRFQRVRVNLLGRYMLSDRREYPCQVIDMSPGGMALVTPVRGQVSERVIAYVLMWTILGDWRELLRAKPRMGSR